MAHPHHSQPSGSRFSTDQNFQYPPHPRSQHHYALEYPIHGHGPPYVQQSTQSQLELPPLNHALSTEKSHSYYPTHKPEPITNQRQTSPPSMNAYNQNLNGSVESPSEGSPHDHDEPLDPKRPRACESCRGLKVRCDPDPIDPQRPCKRCAKARRECIITAPSRKRQKKTDTRVAELEKKIDSLTARLNATDDTTSPPLGSPTSSTLASTSAYGPHSFASGEPMHLPLRTPESTSSTNNKRRLSGDPYSGRKASRVPDGSVPPRNRVNKGNDDPKAMLTAKINEQIDRIIDRNSASVIFDRYSAEMTDHMPVVVFPKNTTAAKIRQSKPILFLAVIVAAAVGMIEVTKQHDLTTDLMQILADAIIARGEKSLELIQALLITVIWYRQPPRFENLNFYQLSHIAAVMAMDMGMGKRLSSVRNVARKPLPGAAPQGNEFLLNSDALDSRRLWLGCYFTTTMNSMTLRRPNLIRWNAYMDECIEVLESSTRSDKLLCEHTKLQHLNEQIGQEFSMDDPSASVEISDKNIQAALSKFETRLDEWRNAVPTDVWTPTLHFSELICETYMHEVALHINHNVDDFRAPFTEESLKASTGMSMLLSEAHGTSIKRCLKSTQAGFDTFLTLSDPTVRTLPVHYFVRIAYGVVVMCKLHSAVNAPGSQVAKIISRDQIHVEYYLNQFIALFNKIDGEDAFRPANRFIMVLTKLSEFFRDNKNNKAIPRDASRFNQWASVEKAASLMKESAANDERKASKSDPSETSPKKTEYDTSSSLHLLSSVATTDAQMPPVTTPQHYQNGIVYNPIRYQDQVSDVYYHPGQFPNQMQMQVPTLDTSDFGIGSGFGRAMDMTFGSNDDANLDFFLGGPTFGGVYMPDQYAWSSGP